MMSDRQRSAYYELIRLEGREKKGKEPSIEMTHMVRDELLRAIAPIPEGAPPRYSPEALAIVERFEAALRRDWEQNERNAVELRALAAVHNALEGISAGRLL
jgi:hypothetical protein